MTAPTMEEWLNMFNAKIKKGNRNFINNATCHPKVTLSNATSVLQPMDMGVIYTFKSHFRRFLMQSLILNIEEALCISKICISSGCSELDRVGSGEN
jgi:hypothetical protein